MTDDANDSAEPEAAAGTWSPEGDPDQYTWDDVRPKDFYLETLLNVFTGLDDQDRGVFGLTVQSNGVTVSGLAISRRAWADAMKATMSATMPSNVSEAIGNVFDMLDQHALDSRKRRSDTDLPSRKRSYIHMRDVRVFLGGSEHLDLPLWRGTLADVTGWALGSWNPPGSAQAQQASDVD